MYLQTTYDNIGLLSLPVTLLLFIISLVCTRKSSLTNRFAISHNASPRKLSILQAFTKKTLDISHCFLSVTKMFQNANITSM